MTDAYCVLYFIRYANNERWKEVTKAEFVAEERRAGFNNTMGQPLEPATAGFGNLTKKIYGRVEYVRD